MSGWEAVVTILGLALITLVTRAFFLIPRRELPLPKALQQALRYAPLAALVAVAVPEVVMTQGHVVATWQDARLYGAAAGMAYFFWRRGILGTIVVGGAVLIALRVGFGW